MENSSNLIFIVAGEYSGDILGAGLIQALKARDNSFRFVGIGGPLMEAQGLESLFSLDRLAVMGFIDPLKRLPELLSIRKALKRYCLEHRPAVFIGIDAPDFNLPLEKKLKRRGLKTIHYVSPSVWAWRQGRIKTIARAVDHMLTLFPFEAQFYRSHSVPVTCVGHPLADSIAMNPDTHAAKQQLSLDDSTHYVALLPGSRRGEVEHLGSVFLDMAQCLHQKIPDIHFLMPAANDARKRELQCLLEGYKALPLTLIDGQSRVVMTASEAVVMASGTTTLEAMLLKKPMVIAYRMSAISFWLLSKLVKSQYIGLPNLLAGRSLVPELIQAEATPQALMEQLISILSSSDETRRLKSEFTSLHEQLRKNASEVAASVVLQVVAEDT